MNGYRPKSRLAEQMRAIARGEDPYALWGIDRRTEKIRTYMELYGAPLRAVPTVVDSTCVVLLDPVALLPERASQEQGL